MGTNFLSSNCSISENQSPQPCRLLWGGGFLPFFFCLQVSVFVFESQTKIRGDSFLWAADSKHKVETSEHKQSESGQGLFATRGSI